MVAWILNGQEPFLARSERLAAGLSTIATEPNRQSRTTRVLETPGEVNKPDTGVKPRSTGDATAIAPPVHQGMLVAQRCVPPLAFHERISCPAARLLVLRAVKSMAFVHDFCRTSPESTQAFTGPWPCAIPTAARTPQRWWSWPTPNHPNLLGFAQWWVEHQRG